MTRLDASNEPSMEDILASIRKIIAEDPPGSRPAPPQAPRAPAAFQASETVVPQALSTHSPAPQAYVPQSLAHQDSVFSHTPVRDTVFENRPAARMEPAPIAETEASAPQEPYLKATPAKAAPASFIPQPSSFFPKEQAPPPARIEPSFAAMSQPVAKLAAGSAASMSVDAQLSDLLGSEVLGSAVLGDVVPTAEPRAPEAASQPARAPAGFPENLSSRIAEPVAAYTDSARTTDAILPAAQPVEHRPGFTVSRDGYVPAKAASSVERDPFDFDLGPSPFEAKPAFDPKLAEPLTAAPAAEAIPAAISDPVIDAGIAALARLTEAQPKVVTGHPASAFTREPAIEPAIENVIEKASVATPAVEAVSHEQQVYEAPAQKAPAAASPAAEPARAFFVAAPSVAATLAPREAVVEPAAAPASAFYASPALPQSAEQIVAPELHAVAEDVVMPAALAFETHSDTSDIIGGDAVSEEPVIARAPDAQPVAVVEHGMHMTAATDAAHRTMEDTVADLLRPMLRTWLAENMPRIVERALRREVSEQLHSEHKTAAE